MKIPKKPKAPSNRGFKCTAAFTLVEVLAALVLLALIVPVISEALTLSSRAGAISERSSIAMELGQNKLDELVLNQSWVTSQPSGDFGKSFPGYTWEFVQTAWPGGAMTQLTVKVYYDVQGRTRETALTTLVEPVSTTTS